MLQPTGNATPVSRISGWAVQQTRRLSRCRRRSHSHCSSTNSLPVRAEAPKNECGPHVLSFIFLTCTASLAQCKLRWCPPFSLELRDLHPSTWSLFVDSPNRASRSGGSTLVSSSEIAPRASIEISKIAPADVIGFVMRRLLGSPRLGQVFCGSLHSWYCVFKAISGTPVRTAHPSTAASCLWRLGGLPDVLSPEEVQRLPGAFDRSNATGIPTTYSRAVSGLLTRKLRICASTILIGAEETRPFMAKASESALCLPPVRRGSGTMPIRLPLP